MLSDELKQEIQRAYSDYLSGRGLQARHGQKLMIAEIARNLGGITLDEQGGLQGDAPICVLEAGTGTGKTVAYLLPTLLIARALGKKLVVATATVALQEQIVNKDLPELLQHSGLSFSYTLAKGRSRYLCLTKLENLLAEVASGSDPTRALYEDERPQVSASAVKIYRDMEEALAANRWNGERDTWPEGLSQAEWQPVTTDHRQCAGRRCANVSSCSFFRARDTMNSADCIVTNQDLVLADLSLGGGAILPAPEDTIYVFDEGHHLPDKALGHFAHHSRLLATRKWLEQSDKGLPAMLEHIGDAGDTARLAAQLPAALQDARQILEQIYPQLDELMQQRESERRSNDTPRYRFPEGCVPEALRLPAAELSHSFDRLATLLGKIYDELTEALDDRFCPVPKVDLENHYPVIGAWQTRAEANTALWASYAATDPPGAPPRARWLTLVDSAGTLDLEVCSSPILAANTLMENLWSRCCGAVVTSATIAALGRFDRYRMRAGTPEQGSYQILPSSFDFSRATLAVPAAAVDAKDAQLHTESLVRLLPDILDEEEASLVLFSSRRQMEAVYEALPESWRRRIQVQGDSSRQDMLDKHRRRVDRGEGSVLFGLASLAEGVDLPGDYCRHVVIAKLPFAVPDDPIEASLSEWVEARGGNAFMEITVPDASLRLIQACGRLLRHENDSGRITLLDKRVVTRQYGRAILNSLPPYRRVIG